MITELQNFRKKYPQYDDIDDATLASKLAGKYPDAYSDLPAKLQSVMKQPPVQEAPITESLGNIPLGGGDIPAGLDPSAINLDTRKIAGKVAPFAPVATGTAASLAMSPVALATGPFAPIVEAGAFGAGYAGGKPIQSFLERYSKGGQPESQENPFVETAKALPEGLTYGMMNPLLGKAIQVAGAGTFKGEEAVKDIAKKAYEKAIRTKVGGKGTAPLKEQHYNNVAKAVTEHIDIIRSENGQLPKTVEDMASLITQSKKAIHAKVEQSQQGVGLDLKPIIADVRMVANSQALRMKPGGIAESNRLNAIMDEWERNPVISMNVGEDLVSSFNAASNAFWKAPNPNDIAGAVNNARIAYLTKEHMAKTIGGLKGEMWKDYRKDYGAQLAIEKEVNDRATVLSRQNIKGFFDLSNIWATGEFLRGLVKMDPSLIAGAAGMKVAKDYIKWTNSPNRIIREMYKDIDKAIPVRQTTPMTKQQGRAFNYIEGKVYEPGGLEPELLPAPAMQIGGQLQLPRGAQTLEEMYPQKQLMGTGRLMLPPPSQIQMYGPNVSFGKPVTIEENVAGPLRMGETVDLKAILKRLRNGELK